MAPKLHPEPTGARVCPPHLDVIRDACDHTVHLVNVSMATLMEQQCRLCQFVRSCTDMSSTAKQLVTMTHNILGQQKEDIQSAICYIF